MTKVGNDRVKQDIVQPTKTPDIAPMRPESIEYPRENDMTPLKSHHEGGSYNKTLDTNGSTNTDQPIEPIEAFEPLISAPKRFGRAQRPTKFYQPGLDYVHYTDVSKPNTYEEAMKFKMDSIHKNQTWELVELPAKDAATLQMGVFDTSMYATQKNPSTKLGSLEKGSSKNMESTMTRYSLQ